jgi:CheY-like chemotaxis protein
VAVTDTGEGMPPDVVKQAFEPYFTTKPIGQGTGLGLSMVYGFAGQSGGFATIVSGTGQHVLVVEDDSTVRQLLADMLTQAGYNVHQAVDGSSGLAALDSMTRVDLLVTDVGLPGMNGRQMADAARAKRPVLPVLFMTGYADAPCGSGLKRQMVAPLSFPHDQVHAAHCRSSANLERGVIKGKFRTCARAACAK